MNEKETKSPTYTIVVDENRDTILTILFTAIERSAFAERFVFEGLDHFKIPHEEYFDLIKDMATKTHEMKWCKDPHCKEKV